jgi:uncharacterized membrane protein
MRQSVLGQTVGQGTNGIGFAFRTVVIKEVDSAHNICIASDLRTSESFQLGLNKRGDSSVWPQQGDLWLIDRSLGHWALRSKITDTSPPSFTGSYNAMDTDLLRLVGLLEGLGIIQDGTTAGTPPTVSGSRNLLDPMVCSIIDLLSAKGLVNDQTTAATLPVGVWQTDLVLASPWVNFNNASYQTPRYILLPHGQVMLQGLVYTNGTSVGTTSTITTLPTGFRPPAYVVFAAQSGGSSSLQLEILNDGTVRLQNHTAGSVVWVTLNCTFTTF